MEDSEADHDLTRRALKKSGLPHEIIRVDSLEEFQEQVARTNIDVILADYRLAGFTALDAWSNLATLKEPPPFILLSGAIGESAAVAAIQMGISDYVHKDELVRLARVIERAIEVRTAQIAKDRAVEQLAASERRITELAQHLQIAIEKERAVIARDIHDDIGGALTAAKLDLAWIARHVADEATQMHVQTAAEMLQQALTATQRIMMNMRPAILDQGLVAATQWLIDSFERRTGIKTTLHCNAMNPIQASDVQLTAFRTVQEALTNISKYAHCTAVKVDLSDANEVLTVEVCDNGQGMAHYQLQKPDAFGIRGLSERAKIVGGWLDVSSRPGEGTSVILTVPLQGSIPATGEMEASR